MKKDQETLKTCEQHFAFAEQTLRDLMLRLQSGETLGREEEKTLRACVALCEELMSLQGGIISNKSSDLPKSLGPSSQEQSESDAAEKYSSSSRGNRLNKMREQVSRSARVKADSRLLQAVENWQDLVEVSVAEKTLEWAALASGIIAQKQVDWARAVQNVSSNAQGWLSKLRTLRHASAFTNIQALCGVQNDRLRWTESALSRSLATVEYLAGTVSVFFKISGHADASKSKIVRRVLELELEEDVAKLLIEEKGRLEQCADSLRSDALSIHRDAHALVVEHARAEAEKSGKMLQYYARKGGDPSKLIAEATEVQMGKTCVSLHAAMRMEPLMGAVNEYEKGFRGVRFNCVRTDARRSSYEIASSAGTIRN